jgi:hypothetical protein
VGPNPAAEFYNPDDMSISNRKVFYTWYEQQKDTRPSISAKSFLIIVYQQESITFSSTANLAYRRGFIPSDTIASIPNVGYQPPRRYSAKGCRWLASLDDNIRHARNWGGHPRTLYCRWLRLRFPHRLRILRMLLHACPDCYPNLATEMHPHRPCMPSFVWTRFRNPSRLPVWLI